MALARHEADSSGGNWHGLVLPLILGLIVFAAALAGILLRLTGNLSFFWVANAVLLGVLVRYPVFATPAGCIAAAAGYIAADLLTGSDWPKTLLLTTPNMIGVYAGLLVFRKYHFHERLMARPACILHLLMIAAIASVAAAAAGLLPSMFLFGKSAVDGFLLWCVTEFTNYIVILPLMLTMPSWRAPGNLLRDLRASLPGAKDLAPFGAYAICLAVEPIMEGPGALAFPVPALLWCAIAYSVATTTFLTFTYATWVLVVVSFELIGVNFYAGNTASILSLRLGVGLAALAPVMVAVVMAERNESLRAAAAARASAEDAMQSRSLLLATMAHELRSPLNAIIGYAGLIAGEMRGRVGDPQYIEDANSIELAGKHLATLVTDLLDTAKLEAGNLTLSMTEVASGATMEQAIRLVRGMAFEQDIRIVLAKGPWPQVLADDRAVKQVMINLISNAIKFSPRGSAIVIDSEIVGDRLLVKVADSGTGIPAEELARLCRAYAQAGDEAVRRKGTGLGLALSMQLVEQHGGSLHLDSTLGVGTTATFDLPVVQTDSAPA